MIDFRDSALYCPSCSLFCLGAKTAVKKGLLKNADEGYRVDWEEIFLERATGF